MIEVNCYDKTLYEAIKKYCKDDYPDRCCDPFDEIGDSPEKAVGGVKADMFYGGTNRRECEGIPPACLRHGRAVKIERMWFSI